jgi:hypothetical protein
MAKAIRSPQTAVANWTQRAGAASDFYASQVQASTWKAFAAADNAEKNYATGVQGAIAAKNRQKAINASSDAVWQAGVVAVGRSRFGAGVSASAPKMAAAMGKLIPDIDAARKALPPRGVRGSADNINRMTAFVQTLAKNRGKYRAVGVAKTS